MVVALVLIASMCTAIISGCGTGGQAPATAPHVRATAVTTAVVVHTVIPVRSRPTHHLARLRIANFQLGWYTSQSTSRARLEAYRQEGVSLLVISPSTTSSTDTWLRLLAAYGLKALLEPKPSWIDNARLSSLRSFVQHYRRFPTLYGWYLYDEPDRNGLPAARLQVAYRAIHRLDSHPIAVNFTTGQCRFGPHAIDPGYLHGFDLLLFDRYPFYMNMPNFNPLKDARAIDAQCVRTTRRHHKRGPIMVLQGFGHGWRDGPFVWRDPTYRETACDVALARREGVGGVLFWSDQYADAPVRDNVQRVLASVNSGHSVLNTPQPTISC